MLIFRTQTLVSNVTKKTILQSSDIAEPFDLNFKQKKLQLFFTQNELFFFLKSLIQLIIKKYKHVNRLIAISIIDLF